MASLRTIPLPNAALQLFAAWKGRARRTAAHELIFSTVSGKATKVDAASSPRLGLIAPLAAECSRENAPKRHRRDSETFCPEKTSPPADSRFSPAYDGKTRARNNRAEGKRLLVSASPFMWAIGVSGGALLAVVLAFGDEPEHRMMAIGVAALIVGTPGLYGHSSNDRIQSIGHAGRSSRTVSQENLTPADRSAAAAQDCTSRRRLQADDSYSALPLHLPTG
jgi:hypothetical protein